jgi:glycosyltransferase involved in cell wall biosynthesis
LSKEPFNSGNASAFAAGRLKELWAVPTFNLLTFALARIWMSALSTHHALWIGEPRFRKRARRFLRGYLVRVVGSLAAGDKKSDVTGASGVYLISSRGFRHNRGMISQPRVTVLIDAYNYGRFIEEAIDSVLSQDFPAEEFEVIVVDDGSTDDTAERVRRYAPRVQYFHKTNGGQASAFNLGLQKAQGEIVALLDADDYWLQGKLRRVVDEFDKHPDAGMVYHQLQEYNVHTGERRDGSFVAISGSVPANRQTLLCYVLYPTSALAFRRQTVEPLLPVPEGLRIQADSHLSGLVIFLAPIVAVPVPLAVYRIHGENLFHSPGSEISVERRERRIKTFGILVEGMKNWLTTHGHSLNEPGINEFFVQWSLSQEADEFAIRPPGRFRFFWHLFRYNYYFAPRLTWRLMLVNYVTAFGALALGYKHVYVIDDWISAIRRILRNRPQ